MNSWPHAPVHRLSEQGVYIVTAGTYRKEHHFGERRRLRMLQDRFFELADKYGWHLDAWAFFSNHYHFVGHSPEKAESLRTFLSALHTLTAQDVNRTDETPRRKVWYQYFDSRLTYEKSYLARLNYVHNNAVHHGLVRVATDYPWCSARWFEKHAKPSFRKTVASFKTDRISVVDGYEVFGSDVG